MLGVTLGIGSKGWGECAHRMAVRMESMTGVQCVAVTEGPTSPLVHPSWAKLWLQDAYPGEDLMIFDADLYACCPWDPRSLLKGYNLAWVQNRNRRAVKECKHYRLDLDRYATSGLLLIESGCPVLKEAQRYYPSYGPWYEEVPLNEVVQLGDMQVNLLPEKFNYLYYYRDPLADALGSNPINLHLVGLRGDLRRLLAVEEEVARCMHG